MSYQALYRKYRPGAFSGVLGQKHITTILKNQVASGSIAHAYLFAGSRGTGKTSTARILARAVNCEAPEAGEPCGKCPSCLISAGENADIVELDAASNSSVDDIRALIEKVRYTPLQLKKKVYIIDEVHALAASSQAFNALLKTLEEPPEHAIFILATTEPQKVPATIISRCQRMDFHRLAIGDMVSCMKDALEKSGAAIAEEGLVAIARAAEGGMRDALSLADQCIAFCGNDVSAEDVYSVLGGMDTDFLFGMADALVDGNAAGALLLLDKVTACGRDVKVFAHDLALHMRALLLAKLCGSCCDLLDCTQDAMRRYSEQAARCGELRLLRAVELLLEMQGSLRWLSLPRVLVESTLVRIARPEEAATVTDLAERIELLEQQVKEGVKAGAPAVPAPASPREKAPAKMPDEPAAPEPAPEPAPQTEAGAEEDAQSVWKQLRARMGEAEAAAAVMMLRVKRVELAGGVLSAAFDNEIYFNALNQPRFLNMLNQELKAIHPEFSIRLALGEDDSLEKTARALFGDDLTTVD